MNSLYLNAVFVSQPYYPQPLYPSIINTFRCYHYVDDIEIREHKHIHMLTRSNRYSKLSNLREKKAYMLNQR